MAFQAAVINVGVVGCGYWGPNWVRNLSSLPGCRLKSVCDADAARLSHMRSLYPSVETHLDFEEFLADSSLDAIVIATGARLHHKMGMASLLSGRHTCIEKPMAMSSGDSEELTRIAREKSLVLMAGHTFLYSPVVRRIKEIVDSGDLGDIRYISARRLNLGIFQRDINVAWDLAPHDLSIILHLMGEQPLSVNCQGSANVFPGNHDITSMWLEFPENRSAMVQSSWLDPRKTREMTIVGSRKMIVYDDLPNQDKVRIYDARVDGPRHYDSFAEFHYAYHYGEVVTPYIEQDEPLKLEAQHFIDSIRKGVEPLTNGDHSTQIVRILEAATQSLAQRGASIPLAAAAKLPRGKTRRATAATRSRSRPAQPQA